MRYILPPKKLIELDFLRTSYQTKKDVQLNQTPSFFSRPTALGGTNYQARRKQIEFLEKIRIVLGANLINEEEVCSQEQFHAHLTAARTMIACCLYVQSQLSWSKTNSVLYRLINEDLGITQENYLDNEDKHMCFMAAHRLFTSAPKIFNEANEVIQKHGMKPIAIEDWQAAIEYISNKVPTTDPKTNPYTDYPITSITQPLFQRAFSYAGTTIGLVTGDVVSKSFKSPTTKYQLTAVVGGSLFLFGPSSAPVLAAAVIAPLVVDRVVGSFCSVGLAYVFSSSMGLVGKAVGTGVGIPLDVAHHILRNVCSQLGTYLQPGHPQITGTAIYDGTTYINGVKIIIAPEGELSKESKSHIVDIRDGVLYLDNQPIELSDPEQHFTPYVLESLSSLKPQPTSDAINEELDPEVSAYNI